MRRVLLVLNVFLIIFLLSLVVVDVAFAQEEEVAEALSNDLLVQFAPIIAAAVAIERLLQLIRNLISPDPNKGLLARTVEGRESKKTSESTDTSETETPNPYLRYYTTVGGVLLGLIMVLVSDDLRLLALADVDVNSTVDAILTAITIGMGTEFVHEAIKILTEGKSALRARARQGGC